MSSKNDNIPTNDLQMSKWLGRFRDRLNDHLGDLGLAPADVAFIAARQAEFADAVQQHLTKRDEARAATAAKHTLRREIERELRPFIQHINTHPGMSNSIRAALHLNQRSENRYHRSVGDDVPGLRLEPVNGAVIVHFGTCPLNEWLNKRPDWARACNIYRRKSGESEYQLIECATSSPYVDEINEEAVTVSYIARYVGARHTDRGHPSVAISVAAGRAEMPEAA